jgi:hypothetical protein
MNFMVWMKANDWKRDYISVFEQVLMYLLNSFILVKHKFQSTEFIKVKISYTVFDNYLTN